jgi:hypothetical protein
MMSVDTGKSDPERIEAATSKISPGHHRQATPAHTEPSDEGESKDAFFAQVAEMSEAMIERHGKEFAIGTLVLAAKFIAEGRPLIKRGAGNGGAASAAKSG